MGSAGDSLRRRVHHYYWSRLRPKEAARLNRFDTRPKDSERLTEGAPLSWAGPSLSFCASTASLEHVSGAREKEPRRLAW